MNWFGLEKSVFYFINKSCANPVFDKLMPLVTFLGDGKFILALAAILIIALRKPKKMAGVFILIGLVISHFAVNFLKDLFERPRPFFTLPHIRLLVKDADKIHSFPSGHATLAFLAAVILAGYFKRGCLFYLAAIIICFSRVYVGVHYPSDVAAGAVLGGAIGWGLKKISKKSERA